MGKLLHIPVLRRGRPYRSLDTIATPHHRAREPFVDRKLIERLLASPYVGRLNLGSIPTWSISWNQPHEGNLSDHLYARRALQCAL